MVIVLVLVLVYLLLFLLTLRGVDEHLPWRPDGPACRDGDKDGDRDGVRDGTVMVQ